MFANSLNCESLRFTIFADIVIGCFRVNHHSQSNRTPRSQDCRCEKRTGTVRWGSDILLAWNLSADFRMNEFPQPMAGVCTWLTFGTWRGCKTARTRPRVFITWLKIYLKNLRDAGSCVTTIWLLLVGTWESACSSHPIVMSPLTRHIFVCFMAKWAFLGGFSALAP